MNMKSSIFYLLVLTLGFASCIKKEVTPLADEGKTFVKILESRVNQVFLSPFSDIRAISLFSVRRDANSAENLQKSSPLVLTRVDGLVTRYNAANGTDFALLPDSLYTIHPSITRAGNIHSATFNAGDFAREFIINLNGAKWDLSKKYALGFALTSAGTLSKASGMDSVIVLISVKNKYDGFYRMVGMHNRLPYNFPYDVDMEMHTTGVNTVRFFFSAAGAYGHPIGTGVGAISWYGAAISPVMEFNTTTDLATNIYNVGSATPIVMHTGAGAPVSRYDPITKKIFAYFYYYTAAGQDFTNRGWSDTLTYVRSR
ncbi:MAG: DUF1735 domain-containing protein [Chitinophagia bacterium]|nr:DUF1735 domain-containing protein [Chitinophagia bacterium]